MALPVSAAASVTKRIMKIRIKFRKYGNLKFIGHLDVQRYFQKAVRRAGIDAAYSTGFSPHQIMSFAAPLGLGLESNGEYMDMEVNSFLGSEETAARLNACGVDGIEVLSVRVLPPDARNAMASVAAAAYTVRFREGREPDFNWKEHWKECEGLLPGIYELKLLLPENALYMLLETGSAGNLKPAAVMEAYLAAHGETLKENALLITREETYLNMGTQENRQLAPLDAIGKLSGPIQTKDGESVHD